MIALGKMRLFFTTNVIHQADNNKSGKKERIKASKFVKYWFCEQLNKLIQSMASHYRYVLDDEQFLSFLNRIKKIKNKKWKRIWSRVGQSRK